MEVRVASDYCPVAEEPADVAADRIKAVKGGQGDDAAVYGTYETLCVGY
jgi:hypothetical protein